MAVVILELFVKEEGGLSAGGMLARPRSTWRRFCRRETSLGNRGSKRGLSGRSRRGATFPPFHG